jgi:hypothetical protein
VWRWQLQLTSITFFSIHSLFTHFNTHTHTRTAWGKMQPIRHALGGLLLEQNQVDEAIVVFRQDLQLHPRNPWALVGLIQALRTAQRRLLCCVGDDNSTGSSPEMEELQQQLLEQRSSTWADYEVVVACVCCQPR